jgi:hypothetical protein
MLRETITCDASCPTDRVASAPPSTQLLAKKAAPDDPLFAGVERSQRKAAGYASYHANRAGTPRRRSWKYSLLVFVCRFKTGVIGTALAGDRMLQPGGSFATTKKIANLFTNFPLPLAPNLKSIP